MSSAYKYISNSYNPRINGQFPYPCLRIDDEVPFPLTSCDFPSGQCFGVKNFTRREKGGTENDGFAGLATRVAWPRRVERGALRVAVVCSVYRARVLHGHVRTRNIKINERNTQNTKRRLTVAYTFQRRAGSLIYWTNGT